MMNEVYYDGILIGRMLGDAMVALRKASTFNEIKQFAEGLEWSCGSFYAMLGESDWKGRNFFAEIPYAELDEPDWSDSELEAAVNDNVPRLMAKLPYIGNEVIDIMEEASRECEKCSKVVGLLRKKAAEYLEYAMSARRLDNEALQYEYQRESNALLLDSVKWLRKAIVAKSITRACQSKISTWFVIVK